MENDLQIAIFDLSQDDLWSFCAESGGIERPKGVFGHD